MFRIRLILSILILFVIRLSGQTDTVRVDHVMGPAEFRLESGDTVRLAFVEPPDIASADTVQRQFASFVRHYAEFLTKDIPLLMLPLAMDDSSRGPLPVHLFNDATAPPLWINTLFLEKGYGRFRDETDTTGVAACRAAADKAKDNDLGLHNPRSPGGSIKATYCVDVYMPGKMAAVHLYSDRIRFHLDYGEYYYHVGWLDEYKASLKKKWENSTREHWIWPRMDVVGTRWGASFGFVRLSKSFGEAGMSTIPICGLRYGEMKKVYLAVDAVMIVIPAMVSLHAYLKYPYAQCWIGLGGGGAVLGIDIPVFKRLLIKAIGATNFEGGAGLFRVGVGGIIG